MTKNYFYNRQSEDIHKQLLGIKDLIKFFKQNCGVYAYLCYGTLLGSIRNNDVISYDSDYDIAYLSKGTTVNEVKEELKEICKILIQNKMLSKIWINGKGIINPSIEDLTNFGGQMHVKSPSGQVLVDVFSSWIENNKYYLCPHLQGQLHKSIIVPFTYSSIKNINLVVPHSSSILLEELYGKEWIVPSETKSKKFRKWLSDYE